MSSNNNMISLTSVSNLRLEQFRTQHELARNFYDDHEFCPVYLIEEVTEHRERIQKRTSPYPSPTYSPPPSYYVPSKQQTSSSFTHRQNSHNHHQNHATSTAVTTAASATRAIPIIDPSNMTPVSVPMQQQYPQKTSTTSPSMAQWIAYKNSAVSKTSPTISNSSISSMSSSSSGSSNQSHNSSNNYNNYYYSNNNCAINYTQVNYQSQQPMIPIVARAIPIIDPATRQIFRQQQTSTNIPPGFYNVSVC